MSPNCRVISRVASQQVTLVKHNRLVYALFQALSRNCENMNMVVKWLVVVQGNQRDCFTDTILPRAGSFITGRGVCTVVVAINSPIQPWSTVLSSCSFTLVIIAFARR